VFLESDKKDTSSAFADEGTAAHTLASDCLTNSVNADHYLGRVIKVKDSGREYTVDADMAAHVQTYLNQVRVRAYGKDLMVEQRVQFSRFVDVPDQFGTADALILSDDGEDLYVDDLKYGRGVRVDAADNEQMMLYALGAYDQFSAVADVKFVHMAIHQPRLDHLSEHSMLIPDLLAFGKRAKDAARKAMDIVQTGIVGLEDMVPGESQCKFCKAKATCPKLLAEVQHVTTGQANLSDFENLDTPATVATHAPDDLGYCMAKVELVEQWCASVRAEAARRLLEGTPVTGFKLVQGRKGSRAWTDAKVAEETLKTMRVKHELMYDYSVISPTSAEKLFKAKEIGPRQWPVLQTLITQAAGKPSVAPESDKREALVLRSADAFDTLEEGTDLV
jgi:hypothetical protein